jgi:plasmid stabilization system protein ParE
VIRAWFLSAALADIEAVFRWYETERPGLGAEFVTAVETAIDQILTFPDACPVIHRGARRRLIERFPYCLYYRVEGNGATIVALLHAARDPEPRLGALS